MAALRIHHISCGRFRPPFRTLVDGSGKLLERADYVVHCLLIELPSALVLVDTGLSAADQRAPLRGLGPGMAWGGGACCGRTAQQQVEALGFCSAHVTHVLLTHLDKDHAGGLADFPQASIVVHPAELQSATRRRSFLERQRYNPRHLAHRPRWQPLATDNPAELLGLDSYSVSGLPETLQMLSLPGHSAGHCGVAVHDGLRWLLHCGDAVYHRAWLDGSRPSLVIRAVEAILRSDAQGARESRQRLRMIIENDLATVFCSHDRQAFDELGGIH